MIAFAPSGVCMFLECGITKWHKQGSLVGPIVCQTRHQHEVRLWFRDREGVYTKPRLMTIADLIESIRQHANAVFIARVDSQGALNLLPLQLLSQKLITTE